MEWVDPGALGRFKFLGYPKGLNEFNWEFDREALEGLKLLDNPKVLNELNEAIDSIVAKEKNKKTIYYFSAAASVLFIIGLVFFFKNEFSISVNENEKPIAAAENLKTLQ